MAIMMGLGFLSKGPCRENEREQVEKRERKGATEERKGGAKDGERSRGARFSFAQVKMIAFRQVERHSGAALHAYYY